MAINRFAVPAQLTPFEGFYQLPFQEMAAALASRQKSYDEEDQRLYDIESKTFNNLPFDDPAAMQQRAWLRGIRDDVSGRFDGDLSQAHEAVRSAQRQVAERFGPAGEIGALQAAYDKRTAQDVLNQKMVLSGYIQPYEAEAAMKYFDDAYEAQGGIGEANRFGRFGQYNTEDLAQTFDWDAYEKTFANFNADLYANLEPSGVPGKFKLTKNITLPNGVLVESGAWFDSNDGKFRRNNTTTEYIKGTDIEEAVMEGFTRNQKYKGWAEQQRRFDPEFLGGEEEMQKTFARYVGNKYGYTKQKFLQDMQENKAYTAALKKLEEVPGASYSSTGTLNVHNSAEAAKNIAIVRTDMDKKYEKLATSIDKGVTEDGGTPFTRDRKGLMNIIFNPEATKHLEGTDEQIHTIALAEKSLKDLALIEKYDARVKRAENNANFEYSEWVEEEINDPSIFTNEETKEAAHELLSKPEATGLILQSLQEDVSTKEFGDKLFQIYGVDMSMESDTTVAPLGSFQSAFSNEFLRHEVVKVYAGMKDRYKKAVIEPINQNVVKSDIVLAYAESGLGKAGYDDQIFTLKGTLEDPTANYVSETGTTGNLATHFFPNGEGTMANLDIKGGQKNVGLILNSGTPTYTISLPVKDTGTDLDGKIITKQLTIPHGHHQTNLNQVMTHVLDYSKDPALRHNAHLFLGVQDFYNFDPNEFINAAPYTPVPLTLKNGIEIGFGYKIEEEDADAATKTTFYRVELNVDGGYETLVTPSGAKTFDDPLSLPAIYHQYNYERKLKDAK